MHEWRVGGMTKLKFMKGMSIWDSEAVIYFTFALDSDHLKPLS